MISVSGTRIRAKVIKTTINAETDFRFVNFRKYRYTGLNRYAKTHPAAIDGKK